MQPSVRNGKKFYSYHHIPMHKKLIGVFYQSVAYRTKILIQMARKILTFRME